MLVTLDAATVAWARAALEYVSNPFPVCDTIAADAPALVMSLEALGQHLNGRDQLLTIRIYRRDAALVAYAMLEVDGR